MTSRTLAVLALCLLTASAFAQRPRPGTSSSGSPSITVPSLPRTIDIQVRIVTTNDRPYAETVRVELLGNTGVPITETFSRNEGMAEFHAINPGSYRIRVSGPEIETTTGDSFQLLSGEGMHVEYIRVPLTASAQQQQNVGGPPTVDASEMKIPGKAKKEFDKGMEAYGKGDYQKASQRFQKASEIYPEYARAYNNWGITLIKLGDRQQARSEFEKAVQVNDHFVPAFVNLARLAYGDKDYPQAGRFLDRAVAIDPNNVEALALLANVEFMNKDYSRALSNARKVHSMPHEGSANVHLVAGNVLLLQNDERGAMSEFELFLKEDPNNPLVARVREAMARIQAKAH